MFSAIDPIFIRQSVHRALDTKGERDAPGQLDVTSIQPNYDVLAGGFARYKHLTVFQSGISISGNGLILNKTLIGPAGATSGINASNEELQTGAETNNSLIESRLIAGQIELNLDTVYNAARMWEFTMALATANSGIRNYVSSQFFRDSSLHTSEGRLVIPFVAGSVIGTNDASGFGSADSSSPISTSSWDQWIPANMALSIHLSASENISTSQASIRALFIQMPKRTQLPK